MAITKLILSAHGVHTFGKWQKEVVDASFAGIEGLVHKPHKYGWYLVINIFNPWSRQRQVRKFSKFYDKFCKDNAIRPSVIAHSFGTWIVTTALRRHKNMEFDRLILCGSIVSQDYPWAEVLGPKVTAVRNELASEDWVVKLLRWRILRWPILRRLVPDAGPSGVEGFTNPPAGVENVDSPYTHSEHFLMLKHCNRYWRPFVRGVERFTDLCWACSRRDPGAWQTFEREYTPAIHERVRAMFPGQSEDWLKSQTDSVVVGVAQRGCEGIHNAETLALHICDEVKRTIRSRRP